MLPSCGQRLPFQGPIPPIRGKCPEGTKGVGSCLRCRLRGCHKSGSTSPVTGGTIVQLALDHGWVPEKGHELDWNDSIAVDSDRVVVDKNWLEGKEIQEPSNWNPADQLTTYLETLFEAGENVGYVTGSWEKTDEKGTRWLPQKGSWDRTAGQLIELLNDCKGDIGAVLGDYNPEARARNRYNP